MRQVEIRHLRYFVAVAEAGSVAAGARVVGIVQPALSRQMRELEDAIGTALLVRQTKGVALTAAGHSFLRDAKQILADLNTGRDRALRAAAGETGELRLGVLPNYLTLPAFSQALRAFRLDCPDVRVAVEPMLSAAQVNAIDTHRLDGGVMAWRQAEAPHLPGILLLREHFVLAVPTPTDSSTPLPHKLSDVAQRPFIWFDPVRSAAQHRFLMAQCERAGFVPELTQMGSDVPTQIGLVGAGVGCALVPQSQAHACPPTVQLIPLDEVAQPFDVEFVHGADPVSPVLARFLVHLAACTHSMYRAPA